MTFDAQDDFVTTELLVKPCSEVKVGEPIIVSFDEADAATSKILRLLLLFLLLS